MWTIQSRANHLYWVTQGVNATEKRRLFEAAFIEVHNVTIEDAAAEIYLNGRGPSDQLKQLEEAILNLRIKVPESD